MTPDESRRLIEAAGGNKAFALQIGIDVVNDPNYAYRVAQWKRRGIPPKVELSKLKEIAAIRTAATRRGVAL